MSAPCLELPPSLRPITSVPDIKVDGKKEKAAYDMNRNQEVGYFGDFYGAEEPLDINLANLKNLENLTLSSIMPSMDSNNYSSVSTMPAQNHIENNENAYFQDNFDAACAPPFFDDPKEGNISKTVRVPSSEHVAEIVGRQGCKIKDLRARTNTYIKTPMRTQSPVFVVTGKEEAVLHVMEEINNAAEHFTHIRASRNHHKEGGGLESAKPVSREGDIVMYVTVPYRVVGLVVGLKGQTIKTIQQDTDTFIVTPNRDKAPIFEIRGQPESVERAKIMILRHIETRTRHCRLQDTTNLPANWNEEQRFNTNEISSFYSSDIPSQNGSNGLPPSNFQGSNCVLSGSSVTQGLQGSGQGSGGSSGSPTSSSSYSSWRGYNSLLDQHPAQIGQMATWSNATSDYPTPNMGSSSSLNGSSMNGLNSLSKGSNPLSNAVRSNNGFNYSLPNGSVSGSISSPSSSAESISPPNEYINDTPFGNNHLSSPYNGCPMNNPFMKRINEAPPQDNGYLSFLTTSQPTPSKNSLVLGNLFQPSNSTTSSLGMNSLMSSSNMMNNNNSNSNSSGSLNMFPGLGDDSPLLSSSSGSNQGSALRQALSAHTTRMFPGHNMGDMMGPLPPSGESSPTSKMSDASGSQGSPIPRMCKVCEIQEVGSVALVPCGDKKLCMECAEELVKKAKEGESVKCPVCKEPVIDMLEIKY